MFDYLGTRLFLGLAVLAVIDFLWLLVAGHWIDLESLDLPVTLAAASLVLLVPCRLRLKRMAGASDDFDPSLYVKVLNKLAKASEVALFLALGWVVLRLYNHLSMTLPVPYADAMLASWDANLFGLWNTYFRYVAERPFLIELLDLSYHSLTPLSVVASYFLLLTGRETAARFFIFAFTITAVIATTIGMFFPAKAAVATVLENKELLLAFAKPPGSYSIDIIERLRTEPGIVFNASYMPGLTTFPSFHTAAGIILAYSFRQSTLFVPVTIYTVLMVAATPVWGGHYFIDVVAGTALALAVCRYLETRPAFAGAFKGNRADRRPTETAAAPAM